MPAEVRRKLGVGPGSVLEWDEDGEQIVVRRVGRYTSEDLHRSVFPASPKSRPLAELKAGVRRYISKRHAGRRHRRARPLDYTRRRETSRGESFVARGAWVSHVVLVETTSVLTSLYDRGPAEIATAVEMLLNHQHLTLQDADVVAAAVAGFLRRPAVGFSDWLVLEVARKAGHLPLGTFDRDLSRLAGAERI